MDDVTGDIKVIAFCDVIGGRSFVETGEHECSGY